MIDPSQRHTQWQIGLAALVLAALAVVLGITLVDPDLWGHVRFGLDILRDRQLAHEDPYSYATTGQRWINHEWLAEVMFGLAWLAGGAAGLIALKLSVAFLTVGALCAHLRALQIHPVHGVIFFILLATPVLTPFFFLVRPQIFTFLLFAVTLLVIRAAEDGRYRWLWSAPPIVALWINFHGGVLAGVGMLGLWAAVHVPLHWHARWRIVPPALATLFALLLNPYGVDLPAFLLTTATVARPEILDWQPLALVSRLGAMYAVVLATLALGLAFSRKPRRPVPVVLCLFTATLPLIAVRHLPLFSMTALVFASEHVADAWQRLVSDRGTPAEPPRSRALVALPAVAAVALLALGHAHGAFTRIRIENFDVPAAAVGLLARSGVTGNLAIEFDWGEYAIWHLGPRIKVGMDGRRETVYAPAFYEDYVDFAMGVRDWDAVLTRHPTDFALLAKKRPTYNLLKLTPGWQLVFEDAKTALFVNQASAAAPAVQRAAATFTAPPPPTDFP
jgi:hypothetical protein